MPEYLAPGVYVEEVSFRSKSIEGVSTTTTGFIGPARCGPTDMVPDIITSLADFELVYGDRQQLAYDAGAMHNYLWHAVRAFFEEGGRRLYCVRVFTALSDTDDGRASKSIPEGGGDNSLLVRARFPGEAGNMHVRFTLRLGPNVLAGDPVRDPNTGAIVNFTPRVASLLNNDVVWINHTTRPVASPAGGGAFYLAERLFDPATRGWTWQFHSATTSPASSADDALHLAQLNFKSDPKNSD